MPNFSASHHMPCLRLAPSLALALMVACAARSNPPESRSEEQAPTSTRTEPSLPPSGAASSASTPSEAKANDDASAEPAALDPAPAPTTVVEPVSLPEDYLHFSGACNAAAGPVVTIAAIGDILLHHELQMQAYRASDRYLTLWSEIVDLLRAADITYGNLESPAAWGLSRRGGEAPDPGLKFDNNVYSGYAKFNIHPSIAEDLATSGFDVISTANNHALDRESLGVDRTLDALDRAHLAHAGTRRLGTEEPWHTVTKTQGLRIAWVACTLHTNFGKDDHDQVLDCFEKKQRVAALVTELSADPQIDAVIVTPHWGKEYEHEPSEREIEYAQRWIDAGATAIIGNHSHVLSPWEKRLSADGREAFVIYSLGNFASHQRTLNRRSTVILYLGLRRRAGGGAEVVGARYVPLHVRMVGDKEKFFVEAIDRVGGPADARALVVKLLGAPNLLAPGDPLDVAPHCRPGFDP